MASHPRDELQQQAPPDPDTLNDHENSSDDVVESLSPQRQTAAVKQIMAQCVAKQSADKYAGHLSQLPIRSDKIYCVSMTFL